MDEKLKALWANNKVLFFILLPLTIFALVGLFLRDAVLSWLKGSVRETAEEAKKQDTQLTAQDQAAKEAAAAAQQQASDAQKRIDDRKETDVPDDWFKNK